MEINEKLNQYFSVGTDAIHGWILLGIGTLMLYLIEGWERYIGFIPLVMAMMLFLTNLFGKDSDVITKNDERNKADFAFGIHKKYAHYIYLVLFILGSTILAHIFSNHKFSLLDGILTLKGAYIWASTFPRFMEEHEKYKKIE